MSTIEWGMVPFVAALAVAPKYTITRDSFGIPTISAASATAAFEAQGYAVAQDRMWQLEMSRRLCEGRLAEVLGAASAASDKDVLKLGYTAQEIDAQLKSLSAPARAALDAYARGVNEWIGEATAAGGLPSQYAANGFAPQKWTAHDSAAIAIHLLLQFGRGGAGEIRNLALLGYLRAKPAVGEKAFDLMDDLAWIQDPKATPTVAPGDDPVVHPPVFPRPTVSQSRAQFDALPKANLLELLPGVQIAERQVSKRAAERLGVPFYTGSYCMVVGPHRSASGHPLLLSGPQMGHTNPSIVHEVALHAPDMWVRGMDIPGVPGVVIGATKRFAWGLTSGVADVEDVFAFKSSQADSYTYAGKQLPLESVQMTIPVKGSQAQSFIQRRTVFGPVVVKTSTGVFALRSAFRNKELSTIEAFLRLPAQSRAADVDALIAKVPMSFNFFYAFGKGDTGYRFAGWVPMRNTALDPRLPTPATPDNDWKGFIKASQMPHVSNPKSGLLVNWNNKPAAWWANGDTPVWGEIFRNSEILAALQGGNIRTDRSNLLTPFDLQRAVESIAKHDETWRYFQPYLTATNAPWSVGYAGEQIDGSTQSSAYASFVRALRRSLFLGTTGNMMSDANFDLALQPTLMLRALQGQTHFDFLHGRTAAAVVEEALKAMPEPTPYRAGRFAVPGAEPVVYSNRGTYIQLLEWRGDHWAMRTILPPGEAESGAHQIDQAPLSRSFGFKPPVTP